VQALLARQMLLSILLGFGGDTPHPGLEGCGPLG